MVSLARQQFPRAFADMSNAELLAMARKPCQRFADGNTGKEVLFATVANATNQEDAMARGFVAGAGVAAFCPEHRAELELAANQIFDQARGG